MIGASLKASDCLWQDKHVHPALLAHSSNLRRLLLPKDSSSKETVNKQLLSILTQGNGTLPAKLESLKKSSQVVIVASERRLQSRLLERRASKVVAKEELFKNREARVLTSKQRLSSTLNHSLSKDKSNLSACQMRA